MSLKDKPFVFLDSEHASGGSALLFENPLDMITTSESGEVETCLEKIEKHTKKGAYLAGFFSYECGASFESKLQPLLPEKNDTPLLWFGVFDPPRQLSSFEGDEWLKKNSSQTGQEEYEIGEITPSLSQQEYEQKFQAVMEYISAGDIYQANLTFKGHFSFSGSPFSFYRTLRRGQQTAFGGMIETGKHTYLSLSPELFFSHQDGVFSCRPMKGTAKRGITNSEDLAIMDWLRSDQKSQAENLMIVDLMRNDMSRISEPGSVEVSKLYDVETYPTLHQMTSSISSRLRSDVSVSDIIKNIFPCGSVTGAPKLRAMEIIHELEEGPRGIYTGAIGYIAPNKQARFNVAIRTVNLTKTSGEIGIGSGLVADSDGKEEYSECLLKMRFMQDPPPRFELLETLKWDNMEGYALLDFHLERLEKSARYFGIPFKKSEIEKDLSQLTGEFKDTPRRVRLLLNRHGEITLSHTPLPTIDEQEPWTFVISNKPTNSKEPFFYHKTTHRRFYDTERELQKSRTSCDEVIFLNERGEITEGSFTNIFVRQAGRLLTPARSCGLLDGTLRRALLERTEDPAIEAILTIEDLLSAQAIYLGNSVRGLIPAKLLPALSPA